MSKKICAADDKKIVNPSIKCKDNIYLPVWFCLFFVPLALLKNVQAEPEKKRSRNSRNGPSNRRLEGTIQQKNRYSQMKG